MKHLRERKYDLLLIILPLLAAGALWLGLRSLGGTGAWAVIAVDGREVTRLPLDRAGSYTWTGEAGSNTVTVRDGAVCMEDADCPDRLCVRQGTVSREGEAIVCLPHRLTVTVEGGGDAAVDAVAQ